MNEIMVRQDMATVIQNEAERFELIQRKAKMWANSKIVPAEYRNSVADCTIALDMADRIGVSPMFVMQNLYVVKGRPTWSGQACIAIIRNCGRFDHVRVVYVRDKDGTPTGCRIVARQVADGSEVSGTLVTLEMAAAEGWGAKWRTIPEQMLAYRAASFFARVYCPDMLMGMWSEGEPEDVERNRAAAPNPFADLPAEPQQIESSHRSEGIDLSELEKGQVMFDAID